MRLLDRTGRNEIRSELYQIIGSIKSIKIIACVACIEAAFEMPSIRCSDDLYHFTYKPLSERFQYYLQDLTRTVGRTETGIIVADHRGAKADKGFRNAHEALLGRRGDYMSSYENLIESLFFQPSDLSIGIQLADMVAGAVWRKYEKNDSAFFDQIEPSFRKSPGGRIEGYGIIKFPKGTWR